MDKETAILQLLNAQGIGRRTLFRVLAKLEGEGGSVAEAVQMPASDMSAVLSLSPESVASVMSNYDAAVQLRDQLAANEIRMVSLYDDGYPVRLRNDLGGNAPPVLFVHGDLGALDRVSAGICGSRKAADQSLKFVEACATHLATCGVNVVSGHAKGVDTVAHFAALAANGVTTIVLATGILQFQRKTNVPYERGESLIISEFAPRTGWAVHNAMQRNLTICGLASAIVLVEPGIDGGTYEAGRTALKLGRPLFLAMQHDSPPVSPGQDYFLKKGASRLGWNGSDISGVNCLSKALGERKRGALQCSLFDRSDPSMGA